MNPSVILLGIFLFFNLIVKTIEGHKKFKKQLEIQQIEKEKDRNAFKEIVKEILKERNEN